MSLIQLIKNKRPNGLVIPIIGWLNLRDKVKPGSQLINR